MKKDSKENEKGLSSMSIILLVIAAVVIIFVIISIVSAFGKTVNKLQDSSDADANSQSSYTRF